MIEAKRTDYNGIDSASLCLLNRKGLNITFKVKTSNQGTDNNNEYYYKTFEYDRNNDTRMSVQLELKPFIEFKFTGLQKYSCIVNPHHKTKLITKLAPMIATLELYNSNEIDIITSKGDIDSKNYPTSCKVKLGKNIMNFDVIFRDERGDVGVKIDANGFAAVISIWDFVNVFTTISEIRYTDLAISLLSHVGSPRIGTNVIKFGQSAGGYNYNSMNSFNRTNNDTRINDISEIISSDNDDDEIPF